ncbi:uncharacterized protein LOC102705300 [Oryza brachyantha]|uniref:uncharacterized protein LOC102705300 n=1 Tax=Oryza brachyantha TaxID=4533 RepID=UPI001ADD0FFD|nr:uncharacterized protein LOC102705300 [Oryza brachyantha]
MEAPKIRFVRCPGCLQLLVEYPSIAVYHCGGCGTVLRAKNRVASTVNANTESGEHNGFSNNSTGDIQSEKMIGTNEQEILPSSNAQPGVLQKKIAFSREERIMSASNIIDSSEHVNIESSLVDWDSGNSDIRIEDIHDEDKGCLSDSSLDSMKKVENVENDGNINSEKGSATDDGSINNEIATTRSMVYLDGAGSNSNFTRELESLAEDNCTINNNVTSQEVVASNRPDEETDSEDIFHPYEGFHIESHEDLIEELMRSLSISDGEDEFVAIAENSELYDDLCSQMGSCRFSWGKKIKDAPQSDPHGRLIEELEMSFSDAEEPLDQDIMVAHDDIFEMVTLGGYGKQNHILDEDGKQKHILDASDANSYEERVLTLDDEHLKSGQSFKQSELASVDTEEMEEGHPEETNMVNHAEANSGTFAAISNLSNNKFCAMLPPSCDKRKEKKSNTYKGRVLCQRLSLDYEDLWSIQNFIESQMDGTSSSLSRGSPSHGILEHSLSNKFNRIDQLERLKKMDDLRDQLNWLSSKKGLGNMYNDEHSCGYDADSIPGSDHIDSYYDHENPPRYPSPDPYSPSHSYRDIGHRQPPIPYSYSSHEFNSYYQSSYAGSTVLEQESLSSSYEEQKRAVMKHILRSLSGASPFTVCNGCFSLVQVPSDIYVLKRKSGKFQCGRCSKALVLSFPATHSEDTKLSNEEDQPNKPVHNRVIGMEDADSISAECSRGDPVSISEECGASFSRSFSGRTRPAIDDSRSRKKVSDSALHRLMGYDSVNKLLAAHQSV